MAGLRNVLVHQYEDVRLPDLYDALKTALPRWKAYLQDINDNLS